jgi:hypothetical protein
MHSDSDEEDEDDKEIEDIKRGTFQALREFD